MAVAWAPGVRDALMRDGYTRTPEDIVARDTVDSGPPLRRLVWPTPFESVKGKLMLPLDEAASFENWVKTDLDHGSDLFDFVLRDHPAPRAVVARFVSPPRMTVRSAIRRVYALDMRIEAPAPVTADLAALAALEASGPAAWHPGVPSVPRRDGFETHEADRILRSNPAGPHAARPTTRQTGAEASVSLPMTPAQLQAFETWFATEAAYGARDIAFPVAGGTHLGCFASGYSVAASTDLAAFIVTFERYLEAVA